MPAIFMVDYRCYNQIWYKMQVSKIKVIGVWEDYFGNRWFKGPYECIFMAY